MNLRINCPKCSGPVWEEQMPDTSRKIDLVCINCGGRWFYDKTDYQNFKKKLEKSIAESRTAA